MGANNPTQRPKHAMPTASRPSKTFDSSAPTKLPKTAHDTPKQLLQHIAEQLAAQTEELQHIRRYAGRDCISSMLALRFTIEAHSPATQPFQVPLLATAACAAPAVQA
jgi:hypothetical protein